MALETLGIPEDLASVLSNLELKKLGVPVWKLQKRRNGYSVSIFWRNAEQCDSIPNARAYGQPTNRRSLRSRLRMEAYNEKKALKRQGESDSLDRVRDTGIPAGSDGAKQLWCETPPAASCHHSLELGHLPLTPCHTLDHPVTQAPPPEQEEIDPGPNADPMHC